jgi:integrase
MARIKSVKYSGVFSRDGGDTWEFRAQFQDETGRWSVSGAGYRTQGDAKTARAASIKEAEAKRGRARTVPAAITVGQYLTRWLDGHSATIRPASAVAYRSHVRALQKLPIAAVKVRALAELDVRRLVGELRASGMAHENMLGRLRVLRLALSGAVREGVTGANPALGIRVPRTTPKFVAQTWTAAEASKFLAFTRDAGDPDYPAYRLAVTTGMRRGELLGLEWQDVELGAGLLNVRRQRTEVYGTATTAAPKTASSEAPIHLDPETVRVLEELRAASGGLSGDTVILCPGTGAPYLPKVFLEHFKEACRAAGVPVIRVHDLRHTAATLLAEAGVPLRVVQERLRHWSPAMTERYTHAQAGSAQLAAGAMGDLLAG